MCLKRRRLFRYIIAAAFLTYLIILIYKLFILKVHYYLGKLYYAIIGHLEENYIAS